MQPIPTGPFFSCPPQQLLDWPLHRLLTARAKNHSIYQILWHRLSSQGALGGSRFCNNQRSALFIFRKCPLFLKEKVPSRLRCRPGTTEHIWIGGLGSEKV